MTINSTKKLKKGSPFKLDNYEEYCRKTSWNQSRWELAGLRDGRLLKESDIDEIEKQITNENNEAVAFAEAGELEPLEDLLRDVYTSV